VRVGFAGAIELRKGGEAGMEREKTAWWTLHDGLVHDTQ
jgi:hypothetical protein